MNKEKFIKCFAHFMTETDLNRAYNLHFKELGKKNCKEIEQWLKDILQDNWIPCSENLPKEHDTVFAKLKGTDKWNNSMFEKMSDDVNVTIEFENGERKTMTSHTTDGVWRCEKEYRTIKIKVIAWMPYPEPYKGDEYK